MIFAAVMTFRNLGTLVYDVLTSVIETSADGLEIEQIKTNHKSDPSLAKTLGLICCQQKLRDAIVDCQTNMKATAGKSD